MFFEPFFEPLSLRSSCLCSSNHSRIYRPLVELLMFCRTDLRFWLALLCIALASAFGICVKTLPYGREWARDCSKNDHSARITPWKMILWKTILVKPIANRRDKVNVRIITLYFCGAQRARIFVSKHYPLLRTRSLIDLWDDVPAEGNVLLLRFEFRLVGSTLLGIGEDGCRLRLGCF